MDEFFSKAQKQYQDEMNKISRWIAEQREQDKQEIFERFNKIEDRIKKMEDLISFNFANVLTELKKISSSNLEKK